MRLPTAKAEGFLLAFRLTLGHKTCTLRKRPLPPISVAPLHHDPRPAPDASPYDICRVAQMFVFVNNGVEQRLEAVHKDSSTPLREGLGGIELTFA